MKYVCYVCEPCECHFSIEELSIPLIDPSCPSCGNDMYVTETGEYMEDPIIKGGYKRL